MTGMADTALIAIDWGTTSLRLWRLDAQGGILERRREKLGIQQVADGDFAKAFTAVTADWRASADCPVLMSGMIGSRQGWVEAPYARCPAGFDDVARQLVPVPGQRNVFVVPGLASRAGDAAPDVMRGEETQILGIGFAGEGLAILPGTHSKWVLLREGAVAWFATFMTGEVYDVLMRHSILGRLADEVSPVDGVPPGFAAGLAEASSSGTLQALFSARSRALLGDLQQTEVAGYLSGLLIGSEIREGLAAIGRRSTMPASVHLAGAGGLVSLYAFAFEKAGIATQVAGEDIAARGLFRLAQAAQLIRNS